MGYFEFRLCVNEEPMKKVKQECFEKNLLKVLNNEQEVIEKLKSRKKSNHPRKTMSDEYLHQFKYFVPHKNNTIFTVHLQLPSEVTCSQCVLQWKYHAGNNYGKSYGGDICLGCAEQQEEFQNCADIAIVEDKMKFLQNWNNDINITNDTLKSNGHKIGKITINLYVLSLISVFKFLLL